MLNKQVGLVWGFILQNSIVEGTPARLEKGGSPCAQQAGRISLGFHLAELHC